MNKIKKERHDIIKDVEKLILKLIEDTNQADSPQLTHSKIIAPRDTKEELKDRIVRILEESKGTLSRDSISAIVSLERLNEGNIALMNLIKNKKIETIYIGETDKPTNINQFIFKHIK